jgi:hypothetical protein
VNYLGCTSLSAYSVGASEVFQVRQTIEANNVSDWGWGAAGAQSVTLSFWVYSSLTGTFGGAIRNASSYNYSYPFSYTVSAANTWELKTVTIAGPTAGTWGTGTSAGLELGFSLGAGSTLSGAAGSWSANNYTSATGATSVVGTNGATFYVTGVQLEAGTNASAFEQIDYGRELAMCQRYFSKSWSVGTAVGTAYDVSYGGHAYAIGTGNFGLGCGRPFAVAMRTAPTMVTYDGSGTTGRIVPWNLSSVTYGSINVTENGITGLDLNANSTLGRTYTFAYTASAEL